MLLSYNHLNEFVDLKNVTPTQLADALTSLGLEVEGIESTEIKGLVVGEILEREQHPKSDKLGVCKVKVGSETKTIMCGAHNARAGLKVVVATIGTTLPGNFQILPRKLMGIDSEGMICSLSEVGQGHLQSYDGIFELPENAKVGDKNPLDIIGAKADTIIDVSLTPNRSDCNAIAQIAKEVSLFFGLKLKPTKLSEAKKLTPKTKVEIKTDLVSFYAVSEYQVDIKDSSANVKAKLGSSNIRLINNVVDATNLGMLNYGNPLHAFDKDQVNGKLEITDQFKGKFIALDDKEYNVEKGDIVILANGEVACLAGIMGSKKYAINNETKNIVVEGACFSHAAITKTMKRLNLFTDSSTRFSKITTPKQAINSLNDFANTLSLEFNANIVKGKVVETNKISFDVEKLFSYIGSEIKLTDVIKKLNIAGVEITQNGNKLDVVVDSIRKDITIWQDVVEEIVRVYGIDNIEPQAPIQEGNGITSHNFNNELLVDSIVTQGFNQVKTYALLNEQENIKFNIKKHSVKLMNPLNENREVMRSSLLYSLLHVAEFNFNRDQRNIAIVEKSKLYVDDYPEVVSLLVTGIRNQKIENKTINWDYFELNSLVKNVLSIITNQEITFKRVKHNALHPGISAEVLADGKSVGIIGKVNPDLLDGLKLEEAFFVELNINNVQNVTNYEALSTTNGIIKSFTMDVPKETEAQKIVESVSKNKFVSDAFIKDVYVSEDNNATKSITVEFKLVKENESFTSEEIEKILHDIIETSAKVTGGSHEWIK